MTFDTCHFVVVGSFGILESCESLNLRSFPQGSCGLLPLLPLLVCSASPRPWGSNWPCVDRGGHLVMPCCGYNALMRDEELEMRYRKTLKTICAKCWNSIFRGTFVHEKRYQNFFWENWFFLGRQRFDLNQDVSKMMNLQILEVAIFLNWKPCCLDIPKWHRRSPCPFQKNPFGTFENIFSKTLNLICFTWIVSNHIFNSEIHLPTSNHWFSGGICKFSGGSLKKHIISHKYTTPQLLVSRIKKFQAPDPKNPILPWGFQILKFFPLQLSCRVFRGKIPQKLEGQEAE